ncbi:hypothetical protein SLA2020_189590 [Shorea laevis]
MCSTIYKRDSAVSKYLGLPTSWGRSKQASLNYMVEKVKTRLQGWKQNLLSQAGREVLIKAVIFAIPSYAMACFKFHSRIRQLINKEIRAFWWEQVDQELASSELD